MMTKVTVRNYVAAGILLGAIWLLGEVPHVFADQNSQSGKSPAPKSGQQQPQTAREKVDLSQPPKVADGAEKPVLRERNPRYKLRYGDVLELKFALTPEFDQPRVIVHPDGFIPLAGIGDLRVEGMTEAELGDALRSAYSKILRNPTITINLLEFETPYFIVGGEVTKPGKYDLRGDTSVAQAVNIAGGINDMGKHSEVWLFRRVSDEWVSSTQLDLKRMFATGDLSEDLHLEPGDMVFVPKSFFGKMKPFLPRTDTFLWIMSQHSTGW
jgi:polysaccharide export outer membrane protein